MPLELKSKEFSHALTSQPETGIGYQCITVKLKNGTSWHRVVCVGGFLTSKRGWEPPFTEEDITELVVSHDKSGEPYVSLSRA